MSSQAIAASVKRGSQLRPIAHRRLRLFLGYISFYVRRHFQGLHLLHAVKASNLDGWPILVCMNHPSWWDPLMALFLSHHFFSTREHYGPIATEGLSKYQFFEKLGFFGIDPKTRAGAVQFLQVGKEVLSRSDAALWVTVQGSFTDVRIRPMQIQAGVAHLAHSARRFVMLPIAVEYAFWLDRKPEAFACVGDPIFVEQGSASTSAEWQQAFTTALECTQTVLSENVKTRNVEAFESVFRGRSGMGGLYDLWRALKSSLGPESRIRLS